MIIVKIMFVTTFMIITMIIIIIIIIDNIHVIIINIIVVVVVVVIIIIIMIIMEAGLLREEGRHQPQRGPRRHRVPGLPGIYRFSNTCRSRVNML